MRDFLPVSDSEILDEQHKKEVPYCVNAFQFFANYLVIAVVSQREVPLEKERNEEKYFRQTKKSCFGK